jgi:hypothetical protein
MSNLDALNKGLHDVTHVDLGLQLSANTLSALTVSRPSVRS